MINHFLPFIVFIAESWNAQVICPFGVKLVHERGDLMIVIDARTRRCLVLFSRFEEFFLPEAYRYLLIGMCLRQNLLLIAGRKGLDALDVAFLKETIALTLRILDTFEPDSVFDLRGVINWPRGVPRHKMP